MKNEVASLMNNEKLMKIFAVAKINRNYSLFSIHYSFLISHTFRRRDVNQINRKLLTIIFLCDKIKMRIGDGTHKKKRNSQIIAN